MYKIVYDVLYLDRVNHVGDMMKGYTVYFQHTNPSNDTYAQKMFIVKESFEKKNPGCEVLNAFIVDEGYC